MGGPDLMSDPFSLTPEQRRPLLEMTFAELRLAADSDEQTPEREAARELMAGAFAMDLEDAAGLERANAWANAFAAPVDLELPEAIERARDFLAQIGG